MRALLTIIIVSFCVAGSAIAQNGPKFGYINSSELLQAMPESAQVKKDLEAYALQLESQLKTMTTEYQSKVSDYQTNEKVWTGLVKESKLKEITDLEQRIQQFQQNAQQSLAEKEQELFEPLLEKAQKAITEVSELNGFAYVFDSSTGALVHSPQGDNILPLVKKHLGIQ